MEQIQRLYAINEAIWIRDNAKRISRELLIEKMQNLAEYEVFSNRQLSSISCDVLKPSTVNMYIKKENKSGGNFSPSTLEDIREVLFGKERGVVDYIKVNKILKNGTSQGMVSKLTGLNQSTISRRISK